MFWAPILLVVTALRQGRAEGFTVRRVQSLFAVTRPTLCRWLRYFREVFPQTKAWRSICGRLWPPVPSGALSELVARFLPARDGPEAGLRACLAALCAERR